MGHQRLGHIPKTQKWTTVVSKVAGSGVGGGGSGGSGGGGTLISDVDSVAAEILDVAEQGLNAAINDPGLRFTFFTLTQVVLAARQTDWQAELGALGIKLSDNSGIFDLTSEVQAVLDDHQPETGRRSDIREMAQKAAGDAIASLAGPRSKTLFGSGPEELKDAIRELSTKKGFAQLGQKFFGRFMCRFLNFYLSRITPQQVGSDRLSNTRALTEFNESLDTHCFQSAKIVRDFCGEWYSKTEFQKGISLENTSGFMAIAVKKLQAELRKQREEA